MAEAKNKYPGFEFILGKKILSEGNHVFHFVLNGDNIITFPVKHKYNQMADLLLIERSAGELVIITEQLKVQKILVPRPGCGNGGRNWKREVKPILETILDDRFWIIDF